MLVQLIKYIVSKSNKEGTSNEQWAMRTSNEQEQDKGQSKSNSKSIEYEYEYEQEQEQN